MYEYTSFTLFRRFNYLKLYIYSFGVKSKLLSFIVPDLSCEVTT